jgi:hypothetical protein
MKTAMILIAAAGMGLVADVANAEDAHVGEGVGRDGVGGTVNQSPRDERHAAVRDREPRSSDMIRRDRREPRDRTIMHERDHERE